MDKSMDSIGSCSLDVDADSSDISDTSGSLNFPTPISIKDITKEFTANIHERCTVRKVNTTATLGNAKNTHVHTIATQPTNNLTVLSALNSTIIDENNDKKPSYLNLACCVNGYSNLTTYDSKIRQDINKSREVSPIRPSSSSIPYCKKNDCLAPPTLQAMPTKSFDNSDSKITGNLKPQFSQENRQTLQLDGCQSERQHRSFIQQRVERLYGPGALAQGFYSQKKVRESTRSSSMDRPSDSASAELTMKFKQLSPSKDYSEFRKKINGSGSQPAREPHFALEKNDENNKVDLPVFRHLSQEFRAQLPKISPKRNVRNLLSEEPHSANNVLDSDVQKSKSDEVDHKNFLDTNVVSVLSNSPHNVILTEKTDALLLKPDLSTEIVSFLPSSKLNKDGNHFLELLRIEQDRLLSLACDAENLNEVLSSQPEISEEVFGLLRSASGKARLLVSQKMKQFEGLCHKNLNNTSEDKFPTTADDLQGFWDMVNLQIDHINSIFAEIEVLKSNDWKKLDETMSVALTKKQKSAKPSGAKSSKIFSNGCSTKSPVKTSAAALKREAQRKQLLEMKRKNKIAMVTSSGGGTGLNDSVDTDKNSIEIFINENRS